MSKKIKKELEDEKAVLKCGDPTRMKICWLLCKHPELSVGEIAEVLNVSVSVVSHSLKKLRESDLVESRRAHKVVFYRLSGNKFNAILRKGLSA